MVQIRKPNKETKLLQNIMWSENHAGFDFVLHQTLLSYGHRFGFPAHQRLDSKFAKTKAQIRDIRLRSDLTIILRQWVPIPVRHRFTILVLQMSGLSFSYNRSVI